MEDGMATIIPDGQLDGKTSVHELAKLADLALELGDQETCERLIGIIYGIYDGVRPRPQLVRHTDYSFRGL
jgi:hypothetical protein